MTDPMLPVSGDLHRLRDLPEQLDDTEKLAELVRTVKRRRKRTTFAVFVTFAVIPIAPLLFWRDLRGMALIVVAGALGSIALFELLEKRASRLDAELAGLSRVGFEIFMQRYAIWDQHLGNDPGLDDATRFEKLIEAVRSPSFPPS